MSHFVLKLFCFLLLQCMLYLFCISIVETDNNHFLLAWSDKHKRAEEVAPPRLFVVGGSGVAFGINSPMLAEQTIYEPVNFGLVIQFGLNFIMNEVKPHVQAGDVVVLIPEYHAFSTQKNNLYLAQLIARRPHSIQSCNLDDLKGVLDQGLFVINEQPRRAYQVARGGTPFSKPPYSRDSLNHYGDVVAHHPLKPAKALKTGPFPVISNHDIDRCTDTINDWAAQLQKHGAKVYIAFPPYAASLYSDIEPDIERIIDRVNKRTTLPILNYGLPLSWPDELFYDTAYHLNQTGSEQRTQMLIDLLEVSPQ